MWSRKSALRTRRAARTLSTQTLGGSSSAKARAVAAIDPRSEACALVGWPVAAPGPVSSSTTGSMSSRSIRRFRVAVSITIIGSRSAIRAIRTVRSATWTRRGRPSQPYGLSMNEAHHGVLGVQRRDKASELARAVAGAWPPSTVEDRAGRRIGGEVQPGRAAAFGKLALDGAVDHGTVPSFADDGSAVAAQS